MFNNALRVLWPIRGVSEGPSDNQMLLPWIVVVLRYVPLTSFCRLVQHLLLPTH
jgi:hypothetical protein